MFKGIVELQIKEKVFRYNNLPNIKIKRLDCDLWGSSLMVFYVQIYGNYNEIEHALKIISNHPAVRMIEYTNYNFFTLAIIHTKNIIPCRLAKENAIYCESCLFNSYNYNSNVIEWNVISSKLNISDFINLLNANGIKAKYKKYNKKRIDTEYLTFFQENIISIALFEGYFEVPRKNTLANISKKLGISEPSVSERLLKAVAKTLRQEKRKYGLISLESFLNFLYFFSK